MATATKKPTRRATPVPARATKILRPAKQLEPASLAKPAQVSTAKPKRRPAPKRQAPKAVAPAKPQATALPGSRAAQPKKVTVPIPAAPVKAVKPAPPHKIARAKAQHPVKPTAVKPKQAKPAPAKTPLKPAPPKPSTPTQGTLALETAPKGIRKRAPKDLAAQYGEKTTSQRTRKAASTPKAARAARKSAEARERLRQVINPSDELLHRLARIGAIASNSEALEDDTNSRRPKSLTPRRPRRWELSCGKCGTKTQFSVGAGVCPRCGTIVVRD